jgi:1L-myo-inositol 1-phosphate cytidylyltransferase
MTKLFPVSQAGEAEVVEAVIIAAGFGHRLAALGPSKPLNQLCGLPLIEIAARQLARAGVERIVVVTGHMADRVEAALPGIAQALGIVIEAVRTDNWSVPNGHSVMAGARATGRNYLLVMSDHVFSDGILAALRRCHDPRHAVTLAIDHRIDGPTIDPDDATFVTTCDDGMIRSIAKHLPAPDAVDVGAFLATPKLAEAIAAAIAMGRPGSLSDGMQWLAAHGLAATMDIGDRWWIDVDDPATHRLAERDLPIFLPHLVPAISAAMPDDDAPQNNTLIRVAGGT